MTISGTASDGRLRLSGDLADFPFADGKSGQEHLFQRSWLA